MAFPSTGRQFDGARQAAQLAKLASTTRSRERTMKVTGLEVLRADAGWRNYYFLKLSTDDGVTGWSEFDEGFGSPGITAVIERLTPKIVGQDAMDHKRIFFEPYSARRRAGWSPRGSARSRTRSWTPKPRRSACRATRCSAASCATGCGFTGRIAR